MVMSPLHGPNVDIMKVKAAALMWRIKQHANPAHRASRMSAVALQTQWYYWCR